MEEENIIINSFSKSLSAETKYITLALTINKNPRNPNKYIEKPISIFLSRDNFYILLQTFKTIKFSFSYEVIEKIILDEDKKNALKVILNPDKVPKEYKAIGSFYLFVKDRGKFVKTLLCYHSIYFMEKHGEMHEIKIVKKSLFLKNIDFRKSFLSKSKNIILSQAPGFELFTHKSGYIFYIKNGYEYKGNTFYYPNLNLEFEINISNLTYVDKLNLMKDQKDIYWFSLSKLLDFVASKKIQNYWVIKTQFYNKKFNLTMDKAKWEGFKIEIRTNEKNRRLTFKNNEEKPKKENEGEEKEINEYNIALILLRRKYIPPFYDKYLDIVITCKEPLDKERIFISSEAKHILETIADSIHLREQILNQNGYKKILEAKVESLLLDEEGADFFNNNLEIRGKACLMNAYNYLYKFLSTIASGVHDEKIEDIIKELWFHLVEIGKKINKGFNEDEHKKRLTHSDIDTFIREFSQLINTGGSAGYFNKVKDSWEMKMWRYLSYCVNGGLTNNNFMLRDLIDIYKSTQDNISISHLIAIQLNNMLNLRIINGRGEKLDPKITSLINQMSDIKIFEFNEIVLNELVVSGTLKEIQNIDNDNNLANFMKYMLDNYPSYNFLKCLTLHLKYATLKQMDSFRKSFLVALAPLINIYGNMKYPLNALEACRCMCLLTSTETDKNNRQRLILNNIIYPIVNYLDFPDEKLIYSTLILTKNILPEFRETISKMKNLHSLVQKLVGIFAGTNVYKCYHEMKTVISTLNVLIDLLKIQPTTFKDILFKLEDSEETAYIDNLFHYLFKNAEFIGDNKDEKVFSLLHTAIFIFFDIYCRKSQDDKLKQMNKNNRLENMLNKLSLDYSQVLESLFKQRLTKESFKKYPEIELQIKTIKSMLTFGFFYITQNFDIKENFITKTDSPFTSLINLINDNKQKDLISDLVTVGVSLKQEIIDIVDIV